MASLGGFCPTSIVGSDPKVLDCQSKSPVSVGINVYNLKEGTTLKEFHDGKNAQAEELKNLAGSPKYIETKEITISGLPAIQTIILLREPAGA